MNTNTIGYFEIESSSPQREIQFYNSLFGWKFSRDNNLPIEYYRIETGTINGGLLKRPQAVPSKEAGSNAFVNSVQVENFDKTSEQIISLGGQIAIPKFAITGRCWQGYFFDADQNKFGIFEVDPEAK